MMPVLSVVVAVYNSERSLPELKERLFIESGVQNTHLEVIFVDDGSSDGSWGVLRELYDKDPQGLKIIRLKKNYGQQNALLAGIRAATGSEVLTMDDDLQHLPTEITKIRTKLAEGYDVVYGFPVKKEHPCYRRFGTYFVDLFFNLFLRKDKNLKLSSFRVMKRELATVVAASELSFIYLSALILRETKSAASIAVAHAPRAHGESNYTTGKLLLLYARLIKYYSGLFPKRALTAKKQYEVAEYLPGGTRA